MSLVFPSLQRPTSRSNEAGGMAERLAAAAADQIANRGAGVTSARSVANDAGCAASAINYTYGGIEQLFLAVFGQGVDATLAWLAAMDRDLGALPATPAGAALALEHVLAEWCGPSRRLALLYQEALAAGAGAGPAADWTRAWRDFWLRTAARFGLGEAEGRLMHGFFESEALYHLSTWSPALERAALRELCAHFAGVWLGAPKAALSGAVALAERTAGVLPEGSVTPAAVKIVEAAAAVVEEAGLGGLTHRAVATRAGVTTGSVTHHYRTVEDLMAGAIRGQVLAMHKLPADGRAAAAEMLTPDQLFDAIATYAVTDRPWGPSLRRRQLFLAAVRRPDLAGPGAVIRFAHGGTVGESLTRLFTIPDGTLSLYAGLVSRLTSASWFACAADDDRRERQMALIEAMKVRLVRDLGA